MPVHEQLVHVEVGTVTLEGNLALPTDSGVTPQGVVLFAHGSGSSRHSPRNQFVAGTLHEAGLATLLIDLLSEDEERDDLRTRHLRFDISMLAERLVAVTDWLTSQPETRELNVGYFGASTGAAASLVAAAERPERVCAIVSRGGRPDLAGAALARVYAPTLLIVGGADELVIDMNRSALTSMPDASTRLEIIPGATHLFEEPGALETVAESAKAWFRHYLSEPAACQRPMPPPGAVATPAAP